MFGASGEGSSMEDTTPDGKGHHGSITEDSMGPPDEMSGHRTG